MKNLIKNFIIFTFILTSSNIFSLSIKDIQSTNKPGFDGTYPSKYYNKVITISGIVTSNSNGITIADKAGAWNSIFVDEQLRFKLNQKINLTAKVTEKFGRTCLENVKNVSFSHNKRINPVNVTAQQISLQEKWESCLVTIKNTQLSQNHYIKDHSGKCKISLKNVNTELKINDKIDSITGIIDFKNGEFVIIPRNDSDIEYNYTSVESNSWGRVKSLYK